MSREQEDDVASLNSDGERKSGSKNRPLSFQSWARRNRAESSTRRPLSINFQEPAHVKDEKNAGSRPVSLEPLARLDQPPAPPAPTARDPPARSRANTASRARPLSISSTWDNYQEKRKSRRENMEPAERPLSRWMSGFDADPSAYMVQDEFEVDQDTRMFHFDEDTDHDGDFDREMGEVPPVPPLPGDRKSYAPSYKSNRKSFMSDRKSLGGNRKSYIENRKSFIPGDRSSENAELEAAKGMPPPGPVSRRRNTKSVKSMRAQDPNMVTWDGPDDPENPKNWPSKKKWRTVLLVSSFTFISPVTSTMVAPALPNLKQDLDVGSDVVQQMLLSIFILAYAIGPLFLGPLSEMYGRVPILQIATSFFFLFNTVCGFAQTGPQMLAFRFLAGLGGSAPLAIGGGVLADLFPPEQRGKAIAVHSLAPLLGPAIGPVIGGLISGGTTWRWIFWAISIAVVAVQVSGLFFLRETWAHKLLETRTKKLIKRTGNDKLYSITSTDETSMQRLERSMVRPFRFMFTQPIVICAAIYMAYSYGLIYLVISSFANLYTSPKYGQTQQAAGLHYLALGIGCFFGAVGTARFNQRVHAAQKAKHNGQVFPEFRVPCLIPCAVLLPIGFFWYGWSADAGLHWTMPDIGAVILAGATMSGYQGMQSYIIDCYPTYAASAVAAISTLRCVAGFGLPLAAPSLYDDLGLGWGNSLLAFLSLAIGVPAPWFFWKFGARLRAKSQYAAG